MAAQVAEGGGGDPSGPMGGRGASGSILAQFSPRESQNAFRTLSPLLEVC